MKPEAVAPTELDKLVMLGVPIDFQFTAPVLQAEFVASAMPRIDAKYLQDEFGLPAASVYPVEVNGRPQQISVRSLHLDLHSGAARWRDHDVAGIEFPLFDPRTPGDRGAHLYAPCIEGANDTPYFNAVASFDLERGRRDVFRYGSTIMAEEHVFVPRPGSHRHDDGWLVGTLLDTSKGCSGIAVLDARHIEDGPLAQAWLPYAVPLGFHGYFAARSL